MSNKTDYDRAAGRIQTNDDSAPIKPVKVSTILIIILPVGVLVALPAIVHALTR